MKIFIELIDRQIWNVIVNGPMTIVSGVTIEKSFDDYIAKNIITFALNLDEFLRHHNAIQQKRCGIYLRSLMKVTTDVKRVRKHALIQEYELFGMQQGETISDVHKQFTNIVNHITILGKLFDKEELNINILKFLDISWQPKVTTFSETDVSTKAKHVI